MNYIEVKFICVPHNDVVGDVLSAMLADIGFESFVDTDEGVTAYVQEHIFNEASISQVLEDLPLEAEISFTSSKIEDKDWNEEWEKNYFKPLVIDDKCIIQSTFHNEQKVCDYNIIIEPKMAFGTGHHQTTELVIREILNFDFQGKRVLDMGCGTAILGILASMRGADTVLAIDIDQWAYDNAKENTQLNNIENIDIQIGGAELLLNKGEAFDVILANINRNILLNDICAYSTVLKQGGSLFMSGFYQDDIPAIMEECNKNRLTFVHSHSKDNWAVVLFVK